ncbi:hypothetical protein MUP77_13575 [Candidatus Bathyarchaeota archaeon]|nr:hypothetical protein [Candidatus Bathyarchaeota archaeon]
MEKSTETKGKTLGSELLKLFEAEASKVDPDMVAEFQKLPIEVRLRALLWAALQISGRNQPIYQPVSDWGGLA